jgi:hypothetical protein
MNIKSSRGIQAHSRDLVGMQLLHSRPPIPLADPFPPCIIFVCMLRARGWRTNLAPQRTSTPSRGTLRG